MTTPFRILVAGKNGQVATALSRAQNDDMVVLKAAGRDEMDVTSVGDIEAAFSSFHPDLLINTAAYTAVDKAETDAELAFAVNDGGAANLARISANANVPIIHLSTDYVFDGKKSTPYSETDAVSPLGVYGKSKLAGEQAVARVNPQHMIIRTSWVYSPYGGNFVSMMLKLAQTRDEIGVVADQIGHPTSADDLANGLFGLANALRLQSERFQAGLYHMSGATPASWDELATFTFQESTRLGGPSATVKQLSSEEYPTLAPRPANSCLDCRKLEQTYSIRLQDWQSGVRACLEHTLNPKRASS